MTKRVLIVGMLDSVHLGRWLGNFRHSNLEFYLFPSSPHRAIHDLIRTLLHSGGPAKFFAHPSGRYLALVWWLIDTILGDRLRGYLLKRYIDRLNPQIVHVLEFQHAGYIYLRSRKKKDSGSFGYRLLVTNYGSDIYWFSSFPSHKPKIQRLLGLADVYSCECNRDVKLAVEMGYSGEIMPVVPNAGGFSGEELARPLTPFEDRTSIAIKGYQGWVGRANTALDALEMIADRLQGYQIELYSCNRSTIRRAKRLRRNTGLHITWSPKGKLSHEQVQQLFRRSAVYVGISLSDGISTSLLEAMACGAIPVQTSTACCDEWFTNTGVRVDTISPEAVADAILAALELAKDPLNAERNRQEIGEKASEEKVRDAALQYYR